MPSRLKKSAAGAVRSVGVGKALPLPCPATSLIPAIYLINSDGSESLVPKDVRGELVVVHATAREFRLRKGDNVLCIFNEAFDAVGVNPGTNTTSPSIERRAKKSPRSLKSR